MREVLPRDKALTLVNPIRMSHIAGAARNSETDVKLRPSEKTTYGDASQTLQCTRDANILKI